MAAAGGPFYFAAAKIRIGCRTRCCHASCRRAILLCCYENWKRKRKTVETTNSAGETLHRFSSLSLKSRITLAASPFCRRNHSPLPQRRIESDAEDRRRHAYCRRNHSSLRQRRPDTFPTSKNFYSTAFARGVTYIILLN